MISIDHFGTDIPLPKFDKTKTNQKAIGSGASKRKKQTDHSKRVSDYWQALGYRVDKLESWQNVNGMWVRKDFIGCIDYMLTLPDHNPVLLQVCAKSDVRGHLRKMLGDSEVKGGETRRHALDWFRVDMGWNIALQYFDQPAGHGGKWETGVEWLTPQLVSDIDSGRRTKR